MAPALPLGRGEQRRLVPHPVGGREVGEAGGHRRRRAEVGEATRRVHDQEARPLGLDSVGVGDAAWRKRCLACAQRARGARCDQRQLAVELDASEATAAVGARQTDGWRPVKNQSGAGAGGGPRCGH